MPGDQRVAKTSPWHLIVVMRVAEWAECFVPFSGHSKELKAREAHEWVTG